MLIYCSTRTSFLLPLILSCFATNIRGFKNDIVRGGSELPSDGLGEAEEVNVKFVTRLRHARSLHHNDYHILEIQRASPNLPLQLHLVKQTQVFAPELTVKLTQGNRTTANQKFLFPEHNKECLYSGIVAGQQDSEVSLFACGGRPGFSGVIMTNSASYSLETKSEPHSIHHPDSGIAHILSLMDGSEENEETYAPCPESARTSEYAPENIAELTSAKDNNLPLRLVQRKSLVQIANNNEVKPRATAPSRSIELAIFADQSFIKYIRQKFKDDSLDSIKAYIAVLTNTMAINYKHPTLEEHLNFRIVHMDFWTKNPPAINTSDGVLDNYLESFCKYAYVKNAPSGGKNWDHAMLFTALNLTNEHKNMSYGGVAYLSGACSATSCSIVKGRNFYAASTMTHEIGHSLGMNHDGQYENKNCNLTGYFMSGTSGARRVSWSTCSSKNLKDFLDFLDTGSKSYRYHYWREYRRDCLTKFTSKTEKKFEFAIKKLPGEYFPPKIQCAFANLDFPNVINSGQPEFCKELYCANDAYTLMWNVHAPLEGSACGDGKWCRGGSCVAKLG